MAVITQHMIDEVLAHLEKSINDLSKEAFENLELEKDLDATTDFLDSQFDIRLENLLVAKGSSTHHLESGMKNKIIQRKQEIMQKIANQSKN